MSRTSVVKTVNQKADYVGVFNSVLCLIHCLGLPFLLTVFSINLSAFHGLEFIFLFVCVIAVVLSVKQQKYIWLRVSLCVSAVLLTLAVFFEERSYSFEVLGYCASLGLVLSHATSIYLCRRPYRKVAKSIH